MAKSTESELARVAAAIGDPARAAMLGALLGGVPLSAGELARRAGVAPATASGHIARLVADGLIATRRAGRHRYCELAGEEVATVLEALARLADRDTTLRPPGQAAEALRFARTCYDHLAGHLGVQMTDALVDRRLLHAAGFQPTSSGWDWLTGLGIRADALRSQRRQLVRPCLDWSERRDHVAGAVGAAIAAAMLERRWVVRLEGTRAVRLTLRGREGLRRTLALEVEPAVLGRAAGPGHAPLPVDPRRR